MTIKQLTDLLYEAGSGRDEVRITVKGRVSHSEETDRGTYVFPVDLEEEAEVYAIETEADGVNITVWV